MERSSSPEPDFDAPFNVSASLAPPRIIKPAGTTTTTFDGLLQEPLLLKEDLKNGCGGQLWPAGMVLSKYLLSQHSKDMAGKSVVELGAGGGLVGLAVARGCEVGMPIHITDQLPMFKLMKDNIALNKLESKVVASILDWGEPLPSHIPSKPDIILAADCVYFEPAFPLLIATLHDLLGPNSVCYFCYKRRRRADLRFMKMAKKAFDVLEICDDPNAASYSRESLYLYMIRLKATKQPTALLTQISPPPQSTRSESESEKGQ
ncbi:Protein-lysine N-methyltransferase EFM6 [Penicillium rolfsii]|nr:Protein-lysine N-methyltransferase EFM6 [Penicillium rolfsii]